MACADPESDYRLTSVLPSPVTPGAEVTTYGLFPPKATLTLSGTLLEATPIPQGLRFTIPAGFVAGNHVLKISDSKAQLGGLV